MEDKKNILSDINFLDTSWVQEREQSCNTVLYLYQKISEKFSKDEKYGPTFVSQNQQLMGQLVQAALSELQFLHQEDSVEQLGQKIGDLSDAISSSLGNLSYVFENKKNKF